MLSPHTRYRQNDNNDMFVLEKIDITFVPVFKQLFITNAVDGLEDFMVSNKLCSLVGRNMSELHAALVQGPVADNIQALVKQVTPPKGI